MMAPAASGKGDVMLIVPYGLYWSEVGKIIILFRLRYYINSLYRY